MCKNLGGYGGHNRVCKAVSSYIIHKEISFSLQFPAVYILHFVHENHKRRSQKVKFCFCTEALCVLPLP